MNNTENMVEREIAQVVERQNVVKDYTVRYKTVGGIKGGSKSFATLSEARQVGMQHFRNGSFSSLRNGKGVALTL